MGWLTLLLIFAAGTGNAAGTHHGAHSQIPREGVSAHGAGHSAGHNDSGHGMPQVGHPGNPAKADRLIDIVMTDIAYNFSEISVARGETIRFRIRNAGELLHEFNIGTAAMHTAHQQEMQHMVDAGLMDATSFTPPPTPHEDGAMDHESGTMRHDDPNALLLEPGQSGEVTWTFDPLPADNVKLLFACNLPGHYEAGMAGQFRIVSPDAPTKAPTPSLADTNQETEE